MACSKEHRRASVYTGEPPAGQAARASGPQGPVLLSLMFRRNRIANQGGLPNDQPHN